MKLEQLTLKTRDLVRARSFYIEKLGLPVVEEAGRGFVIDAGGLRLHVDEVAAKTPLPEAAPRLCFHTSELMQRCMRLRDNGVSVEGPRRAGPWMTAELADPDGHPIVLMETR